MMHPGPLFPARSMELEAHAEAVGRYRKYCHQRLFRSHDQRNVELRCLCVQQRFGNISIITSAGDVINAGSAGINAVNEAATIPESANSSIVITAAGIINSGTRSDGYRKSPGRNPGRLSRRDHRSHDFPSHCHQRRRCRQQFREHRRCCR